MEKNCWFKHRFPKDFKSGNDDIVEWKCGEKGHISHNWSKDEKHKNKKEDKDDTGESINNLYIEVLTVEIVKEQDKEKKEMKSYAKVVKASSVGTVEKETTNNKKK